MTFSLTADKRLVVSSESGGGSRGRGRGGGRGKGRGGGGRGRGRGRGEKDDGDSLMVGASRTDHRIAPKPPPKEITSTTAAAAPVEPKQTKQVSATLEKSEVKPATPPKPPSSPDQNTDGASRETGEEREGGGQPLSGSSPSDRTGAETSEMASKRAPTPPPTTGSQPVSKPKRYSSRRKTGGQEGEMAPESSWELRQTVVPGAAALLPGAHRQAAIPSDPHLRTLSPPATHPTPPASFPHRPRHVPRRGPDLIGGSTCAQQPACRLGTTTAPDASSQSEQPGVLHPNAAVLLVTAEHAPDAATPDARGGGCSRCTGLPHSAAACRGRRRRWRRICHPWFRGDRRRLQRGQRRRSWGAVRADGAPRGAIHSPHDPHPLPT
ncbi:hypothetical protein GBAR_LOCUS31604 [Geodia barretti]|uniref:Uncharacterized protein n=2 Tax=Geodia barretti TaxID=519541 RepID=A0AA35U3J5_GEOBA|nr:hypothetical protein GBAR_LOCUS31604 [Geodia barretti]